MSKFVEEFVVVMECDHDNANGGFVPTTVTVRSKRTGNKAETAFISDMYGKKGVARRAKRVRDLIQKVHEMDSCTCEADGFCPVHSVEVFISHEGIEQ